MRDHACSPTMLTCKIVAEQEYVYGTFPTCCMLRLGWFAYNYDSAKNTSASCIYSNLLTRISDHSRYALDREHSEYALINLHPGQQLQNGSPARAVPQRYWRLSLSRRGHYGPSNC